MSFLDLFFFKLRERERERERERGIQNLGIKENGPKVTYLIFRRGSTGESFFFHGLIDFILLFFYTGLKNLGSFVSQLFFCLQPGVKWFVCPLRTLLQKTAFLLFTSAEGKGSPLPFWGPSQSFGFCLLPLVSGDLRLLSTNTCWYPSVTYILP